MREVSEVVIEDGLFFFIDHSPKLHQGSPQVSIQPFLFPAPAAQLGAICLPQWDTAAL